MNFKTNPVTSLRKIFRTNFEVKKNEIILRENFRANFENFRALIRVNSGATDRTTFKANIEHFSRAINKDISANFYMNLKSRLRRKIVEKIGTKI